MLRLPENSELPETLESGLAQKHLPALDGLRAVAAFIVVFYHSAVFYDPHTGFVPGGMGVLAFFVLSGFLITWLLLQEQERYGTISLKLFYARRSLRIFPAFYAFWLLILARAVHAHRITWPQALAPFFYVNNYYDVFGGSYSSFAHTWSLAVEEQFYLLWPISFLLLQRYTRKQVVRILLVAITCVWFYRWFLLFGLHIHTGYIYSAFETRADQLLWGCVLAFVLRTGAFSRLWQQLCATPMYSVLFVVLLGVSISLGEIWGRTYREAVGFVVDPFLIALLIPQLMAFRNHPMWSWLNWRWVRYLGTISYSIYLYQQITPGVVHRFLSEGTLGFTATNAVLVVAIASLSYFLVERPFLRIKDRLANLRRSSTVKTTAVADIASSG